MNALSPLLFAILFVFSLTAQASCFVVKVADGDTLTVRCGQQSQEKVRLFGIDAPEKHQAYGQKAREALAEICAGKMAALERRGKDQYGRTLALVTCDGVRANYRMVETGYAWVYRKFTKDPELLRLESAARKERLGLWADKHPVNPSVFRKANHHQ